MRRIIPLIAALCFLHASAADDEQMSWLDNGKIRLGVDLSIGGSVTYLRGPNSPANMINSYDWGRQIQMSFYSGPVPFDPPGVKMEPAWKELGWNPIQSGDAFHHRAKTIATTNDGKTIYVKSVPMIWPLDNSPGECTFECWYTIKDNTVEVTSRLNNARADKTQYPGRDQELPAVYTNGLWYKLVSYLGDKPFTGAPVTTIVDKDKDKGFPWVTSRITENWMALLNDHDTGLGVFEPGVVTFSGGFAGGPKGTGGDKDFPTGYIGPNLQEILDADIGYEFRYVLIAGTADEIRAYAVAHRPDALPAWSFARDRQDWTYQNVTDAGWPIAGELRIPLGTARAAALSPVTFWHSEDAPVLYMQAAFDVPKEATASVLFQPYRETDSRDYPAFGPNPPRPEAQFEPVSFPINGDGAVHVYEIPLHNAPGYHGAMLRLKLSLPEAKGEARIKYIGLKAP